MSSEDGAWIPLARLLSWVVAVSIPVAAVMALLLSFDITAPKLKPPSHDLLTDTIAVFENDQIRWPQEMTQSLLFALGFAALAGLGVVLARVLATGGQSAGLSYAFGAGGILGVAAQLIHVGATQVAINPGYCDCKYAAEQVLSRAQARDLADGAQRWLLTGFLVLTAVAFVILAAVARQRDEFRTGWVRLGQVLAVAFALTAITVLAGLETAFNLMLLIGAAILVPVWAVWLERQLASLSGAGIRQRVR